MINSVDILNNNTIRKAHSKVKNYAGAVCNNNFYSQVSLNTQNVLAQNTVNTILTNDDTKKYLFLINYLRDVPISQNSDNLSCQKQLELLLKNGKLLSKSKSDSSTTLDNLYAMATTKRVEGLDPKGLISNTLDILVNPKYITQNFGDIPDNEKRKIVSSLDNSSDAKKDPGLMDIESSGTCAAASIEVNLANKYPAEFARWINGLSGPEKSVYLNVDLTSLSKNKLEAIRILNLLKAKVVGFSLDKAKIKINSDDNAYIRAYIQSNYWDKGERNAADVLVQSAIMNTGSQGTYDTLTDTRKGDFSSNPQGLIELEKTFVESLIKNKEITSLVYQQIDDNQNLVGYNCSLEKIEKHIKDALKTGENVIIGYVLTNETSGRISSGYYNPNNDGPPNRIINGHEITIVDYKINKDGKTIFVCVDTDDDNPQFVEYSAEWLLPKIHHAGYPAYIVEKDEKEIMKNVA